MMIERLLTLSEACERSGIHPNTPRKWDKQGKIRVVRTVGVGGGYLKVKLNV
ncbi:MAG: hypothetical protein QXY80_06105 [Candidatus Jordarchaeales archaeon]